jgi:hypothetical protein
MLHELLERIPVAGEECAWRGYRIQVLDVGPRGQLRARFWKEAAE